MEKIWYVTTHELGSLADGFIRDNPHSNGYAIKWEVINPAHSAYPELENYFLAQGLKFGDEVIVHSKW